MIFTKIKNVFGWGFVKFIPLTLELLIMEWKKLREQILKKYFF